jgi:hypothetical protein
MPSPLPLCQNGRGAGVALPKRSKSSICSRGAANEFARYEKREVALRRLPAPRITFLAGGLGACAGRLGDSPSARFQPPRASGKPSLWSFFGQSRLRAIAVVRANSPSTWCCNRGARIAASGGTAHCSDVELIVLEIEEQVPLAVEVHHPRVVRIGRRLGSRPIEARVGAAAGWITQVFA